MDTCRFSATHATLRLQLCQEVLNLKHLSSLGLCDLVGLFVFQVRNEPKNIYIAAEYIAKIKGIPVGEVIEVTTQNALKVFPKLQHFLRI